MVNSADMDGRIGSVLQFCSVPKPLLALGIGISLVEVAATLVFPLMVRQLIDTFDSGEFSLALILLEPLVLALMVVLVLAAIAGGLSSYLLSIAGHRIVRSLKQALFDSIISRDASFFDQQETGALVSRMSNDTRAIVLLLSQGLSGLFGGITLLLVSMLVLFLLDASLAGVILLIIIVTVLVISPIAAALAKIAKRANDRQAGLSAFLTRTFAQTRLVKAFKAERQESKQVELKLEGVFEQSRRSSIVKSTLQPITGLALSFAFLSIMIYGGSRVESGSLSVGTLTAFILYIVNLVAPLIQFSFFLSQYQEAKASAYRLNPLLNQLPGYHLEKTDYKFAAPHEGDLTIVDLKFSYSEPAEHPLLEVPFLQAKRGRVLVISGRNGSGKSTLFSLLLRFYEPHEGAIRFGDVDITTIPTSEWRSKLGYMFQETVLSTGSVAQNVAYGSAMPIDEDCVVNALIQAGCDDFVGPGKLDIHDALGESGKALSGGQAQRIGLARILYRDPDIVLLDEPTANLDPINTLKINRVIEKLTKDRIVIVISHRPLELDPKKVDLVQIDNGRVMKA